MCHVLIIEDEALIALDLQDLLEGEGATSVMIAATQDEAIAAARLQMPDLITSDVTLREGTGPHAVRAIIAELGPVPVIFITATPHACHTVDVPAVILGKPLAYSQITTAFHELARRHR